MQIARRRIGVLCAGATSWRQRRGLPKLDVAPVLDGVTNVRALAPLVPVLEKLTQNTAENGAEPEQAGPISELAGFGDPGDLCAKGSERWRRVAHNIQIAAFSDISQDGTTDSAADGSREDDLGVC